MKPIAMHIISTQKKLVLTSLLSLVTLPALADNFYVFGDLGQGKMEIDAAMDAKISRTSTSYSLGAGVGLNPFVAFEIAYRDLGDITNRGDAVNNQGEAYRYVDTFQTTALQVSLLGKLPISDEFTLYSRVGLASIDTDDESRDIYADGINPPALTSSKSKTRALFGLGASFDISSQLTLRTEYNQYAKWGDVKLSALTVGAVYSF